MGQGCHHQGPHQHERSAPTSRLIVTIVLVGLYCIAEVVGGIWTGSLALLADAGHMLTDLVALGISLFAAWMATRRPSQQHTFGFYRAEILAALANGSLLFLVAGGILHEAYDRLLSPHPIFAGPMAWIAAGGLIVNLVSLAVLHGGREENLNLRGAWLHVAGDTLGSIGVLGAALLIWLFGWVWADPVASVLVCLLIIYSSWHLVSDAAVILMEQAPRDIEVERVRRELLEIPHVTDVHCLHVWTIATGLRALSAHIVLDAAANAHEQLAGFQAVLKQQYDLDHVTLQLETSGAETCKNTACGACLLGAGPGGPMETDQDG